MTTNRNGSRHSLGLLTVYCTDEFQTRWNQGDVDEDWDSLWLIIPTTSRGLPTHWEGTAAEAIAAGLVTPAEFENVKIQTV